MTLTPSHRPVLADEVTAKLRDMIKSGEWPLQERIPAEPELMATLGVSRGTLREAIKALAHTGMLEVRRGDGTYVRANSEILGAAQRIYREHTQEHIVEVRLGLDTQAARLATKHATAGDIAEMRRLLSVRHDSQVRGLRRVGPCRLGIPRVRGQGFRQSAASSVVRVVRGRVPQRSPPSAAQRRFQRFAHRRPRPTG